MVRKTHDSFLSVGLSGLLAACLPVIHVTVAGAQVQAQGPKVQVQQAQRLGRIAASVGTKATGHAVPEGGSQQKNPREKFEQELSEPESRLYLAAGDQVAGHLRASSGRNVLRWQGRAFTEPFDFPLRNVRAVQFPMMPAAGIPGQSAAVADFGFELAGGDLLYGNLLGMTADKVELEVPGLGRLQIRREYLRRMVRRRGAGNLIYLGPKRRTDWLAKPEESSWREEAGHLVTDQAAALLRGNFVLPALACVEIELSWEKQANFVLALGVAEGVLEAPKQALRRAFRLEVWQYRLVALRESDSDADVAALARLKPGAGRIHLLMFLDQTRGRLRVLSAAGKLLGEVRGSVEAAESGNRLWLRNRAGDLCLEGIRVSRWDGALPREGPTDRTWVQRLQGSPVMGDIERYDPRTGELVLAENGAESKAREGSKDGTPRAEGAAGGAVGTAGESRTPDDEGAGGGKERPGQGRHQRIPLDDVAGLRFGRVRPLPTQAIRVLLQDGCRLQGELLKVTADSRAGNWGRENRAGGNSRAANRLWMRAPAIVQPIAWPVDRLGSLLVLQAAQAPILAASRDGRAGRLESSGTQLHGRLVVPVPTGAAALATPAEPKGAGWEKEFAAADAGAAARAPAVPRIGPNTDGASCLCWQPRDSITASPMKQAVAARIVYHDPPAPKPRSKKLRAGRRNRQPRPQQLPPGVWGALMKALAEQDVATSATSSGQRLYLRSGDAVPCEVARIDSAGVHFLTPLSETRLVPNDQVKAVVLARSQRAIVLSKAKRLRLLTLPRMRRDNPPTHLLCSVTGDYLRGRLLGMDANTVRMEVRLEVVSVPRERVSHIIWLHEDELDGDQPKQGEPAGEEPAGVESEQQKSAARKPVELAPTGKPASVAETETKRVAQPLEILRAQAVHRNGVRMTFAPQRLVAEGPVRMPPPAIQRPEAAGTIPAAWKGATALIGSSSVLGGCRVELKNIDRLLLGGAIEREAAQLAVQEWRLHQARQPKIAAVKSGSRIPGTAAALVGQPAPDFQLETLDGKTFRLHACQGQVVVLDFWATWCGPCMQAMPRVDRLVRALPGARVRLVAVNLQETPAQITSALERHGLAQLGRKTAGSQTVVALDLDGVVAEKYTATAIPQTVVIDPQGNVARLFVGGGPQRLEQLGDALESLLKEGKSSGP